MVRPTLDGVSGIFDIKEDDVVATLFFFDLDLFVIAKPKNARCHPAQCRPIRLASPCT